jgi:hypothetical protein
MGSEDQCRTLFFENPPRVAHIVEEDCRGVAFFRLIYV